MSYLIRSIVLLLLVSQPIQAQKFKLGDVDLKALQQSSHPLDSSASAAILFNKASTVFKYSNAKGFSVVHEFQIRIKIYKKEGLSYANWEVPYYVGYENIAPDMMKVSDGVTYNIEDGKIKKTKLTGEGTFKERVNENWKTVTIALPDVKVGSVIEFKYVIRSEDLSTFPTFKFQYPIPVNFAEYKTDIPLFYKYQSVIKGLLTVDTTQEITEGHQNYDGDYNRSQSISYKQISSLHSQKDIPALKAEPFVDHLENYRSAIEYELESIQFPEQAEKNFSKTWEGVAKTIYEDEDFGKQLKMRDFFEADLRGLVKDLKTPEEKMQAIFNYVKVKMSWTGDYGYFARKGVKKAYLERTGNVAEINFILIAMLNSAGILTKPVLVSTINNGIASLPNRTGFNYVIAAAEINGKKTLLDATDKFSAPNILPLRTLNWTGRLINDDGSSENVVMSPSKVSKSVINLSLNLQTDHTFVGKARIQRTDYDAFVFRDKYANLQQDNYLENLENEYGGIEISNYTVENETKSGEPISQQFDFASDNYVDVIGNKVYITPMVFLAQVKNPMVQDSRILPMYFGYPLSKRMSINIVIPDGYTVESMPKGLSITTGEDVGNFKYLANQSGNQIQLSVTTELNQMMVSGTFYAYMKEYFQKITDKMKEPIVLVKN